MYLEWETFLCKEPNKGFQLSWPHTGIYYIFLIFLLLLLFFSYNFLKNVSTILGSGPYENRLQGRLQHADPPEDMAHHTPAAFSTPPARTKQSRHLQTKSMNKVHGKNNENFQLASPSTRKDQLSIFFPPLYSAYQVYLYLCEEKKKKLVSTSPF